MTCYLYAGRKSLVFRMSTKIDVVFGWPVEVDLISVWEIDFDLISVKMDLI